ncbi:uncharacterized protein [Clytia hemisphaerica]|uniref:uncharacterized protein n=1 Tax=Clytia hemisphaerica TaxID=252671 RepID=UPI0034D5E683
MSDDVGVSLAARTIKRQKSADNTYDYADFSQVSKEIPNNNNYEYVEQKPKKKKNKNKKQSKTHPADNEGYEVTGPRFVTPNLIYEDSSSNLPLNEYEDVATKPKPVLDEQIYQEADTPNPIHKKPQSPRKLNAYEVADLPESSGQVSDLPGVTIKREQNASYEPANSFLREENENIYYETEPSPAAQSFLQSDTENFYYEKEPSPLAQRQQENSYYAKDGLLNQDLSDDNIYTEPDVGSASPNTHINPIYG